MQDVDVSHWKGLAFPNTACGATHAAFLAMRGITGPEAVFEGDKTRIGLKEEADHSLPYMVAVALLDGDVLPPQYAPERIVRSDVQALLRRVVVRPSEHYSRLFPENHACMVTIVLRDGRRVQREKMEYEGFVTRPMTWESVRRKFDRLAAPHAGTELRERIVRAVLDLEHTDVRALTSLLARVGVEEAASPLVAAPVPA